MAKRDDHEEEGGAWEIALADLMTVLMVFFLVMWLVSIVDPSDRQAFVDGLEGANKSDGTNQIVEKSSNPTEQINPLELKPPIGMEEVEQALSNVNPRDIEIEETDTHIKITLRSDSFFESGRATLNDKTLEQLEVLGESLAGRKQGVRITGYTDSIPISNLQFPSNWELSAARAATVARTFIYMGLEKDMLTIQGKADNNPVAENDNAYGRSLNRRVIIMVNKMQGELNDDGQVDAPITRNVNNEQGVNRQGLTRQPFNTRNTPQTNNRYSNQPQRFQPSPNGRVNSDFRQQAPRNTQPDQTQFNQQRFNAQQNR